MNKPLLYCLSVVAFISLSEISLAQTHKKKKRHTTTHKTTAIAPHRPAGWGGNRAPYTRAPVLWEGYKYYTYHPYHAFPYKPAIAPDTVPIRIGDETYFYHGGKFYLPVPEQTGYQLVKAPAGAYVFDLPPGCIPIHAGSVIFLQYNGDYYLPVEVGRRLGYEVVNVEAMAPQW